MQIRSKEIIRRYNEAKAFVKLYEEEYRLELAKLATNDFFDSHIWMMREEIAIRQTYLKSIGCIDNLKHPYNLQIKSRKKLIKERLKELYHERRR